MSSINVVKIMKNDGLCMLQVKGKNAEKNGYGTFQGKDVPEMLQKKFTFREENVLSRSKKCKIKSLSSW